MVKDHPYHLLPHTPSLEICNIRGHCVRVIVQLIFQRVQMLYFRLSLVQVNYFRSSLFVYQILSAIVQKKAPASKLSSSPVCELNSTLKQEKILSNGFAWQRDGP